MKVFEDEFMDQQSELISLCLEVAEGKADKIYAYASIEKTSQSFNAFFQVGNEIVKLGEINSNQDLRLQFLDLGTDDLTEIRTICKKHGRPTPTEMKMIYDVHTGEYNAEYKYEEICTPETGVWVPTVFMDWMEEIKAKL